MTTRYTSSTFGIVIVGLVAMLAGCMGPATREVIIPQRLIGAKITADGEPPVSVYHDVALRFPIKQGTQLVRIEQGRRAVVVDRIQTYVNDPQAPRGGANIFVAKIEESMTYRSVVAFPDDPLSDVGPRFEPPASGEGLILLASVTGTAVAIDGRALDGGLPAKAGKRYESFVTEPRALRLGRGPHTVDVAKPGYAPVRYATEVHAGEYELLGFTLEKIEQDALSPLEQGGAAPPAKVTR